MDGKVPVDFAISKLVPSILIVIFPFIPGRLCARSDHVLIFDSARNPVLPNPAVSNFYKSEDRTVPNSLLSAVLIDSTREFFPCPAVGQVLKTSVIPQASCTF